MTLPQRTQITVIEHDNGAGGITFTYTVPAQAIAQVIWADGGNGNGWAQAESPTGFPLWACVHPGTAAGYTAGILYNAVVGDSGNAKAAANAMTGITPAQADTYAGIQILGPGCTLTLTGPNSHFVVIESKLVG